MRRVLAIVAGRISEANQALGRTRKTTLDENVIITYFAIVEETTIGGYLVIFWITNP